LAPLGTARAAEQDVKLPTGFQSHVLAAGKVQANRASPSLVGGKVIQPRRELPVLHATDVLVVGAGSAGVTAAIAARRTGAKVTQQDACPPRDVDLAKVQKVLRQQGAYLG